MTVTTTRFNYSKWSQPIPPEPEPDLHSASQPQHHCPIEPPRGRLTHQDERSSLNTSYQGGLIGTPPVWRWAVQGSSTASASAELQFDTFRGDIRIMTELPLAEE